MKKRLSIFVCLIIFSTQPVFGQWVPDGLLVCTAPNSQEIPAIVTDGAGGAIVLWKHWYLVGEEVFTEIRAQRIDPDGYLLWGSIGRSVLASSATVNMKSLIPDGAGGAIFTFTVWDIGTDTDINVQRINADGSSLWGSYGKAVCTEYFNQNSPQCVSEGSYGAIIVWADYRGGPQAIFAQRVSGDGVCLWDEDGIAVNMTGGQTRIASDGSDGAIITWSYSDIFAQRIDPDGIIRWADGGVSVCMATDTQSDPRIVSDGSHGAIIMWEDWRDGFEDVHIYAQKVNSNGNTMWSSDGELVCSPGHHWFDYEIISDGAGGAIVTWMHYRDEEYDIYAQRVGGNGNILWDADGVVVCDVAGGQGYPAIVPDGNGGAIIVWGDYSTGEWKYYAQRFDEDGNALWSANGIAVCEAADYYSVPVTISDGAGGAMIAWTDHRLSSLDIFAEKIGVDGALVNAEGLSPSSHRLYSNYPNPFNPTTTIRFHLSERSDVQVDIYDVTGAHVTRLASGVYEQGMHSVPWNGCADDGRTVSSGIYFSRLTVGANVLSRKMVLLK